MKRSNTFVLSWIALAITIVGAILESVVWDDWVTFGFDVVAILGISHFLFQMSRRASGGGEEKEQTEV